jgi:hypothetical protein
MTFTDVRQSLWATTSTFGFHNLIGVMIAIGVATYIIAFNLRRISELYQSRRRKLVNSMINDSNWRELGEGLKKSWSDNDSLGPSEWWVFIYFARSLFSKKWNDRGGKKGNDGGAVKTDPDGHETKEIVMHANEGKVKSETSKDTSKQTITLPTKSWFHLRRSRVRFSSHSKDKEPDIEGQKSSPDSETDTGKGKGKDMMSTRDIEEKEVEEGDGTRIV